ncbi:unnamed protein product [Calypogeia fissa]
MVGFGKYLKDHQNPAWEQYYISYKVMKKRVNRYRQQLDQNKDQRQRILKEFSLMLDRQVEKTVLFLLEKQGQLAHRLAELGLKRLALEEAEDWDGWAELPDAYRAIGKDLLKLLYFVEMNATGLRKILKKFDKRIGYRLTDEYVASRSNHPFSQLQQVFRHVGIGAMVGTISRNLAELQSKKKALSIYDVPSTPTSYVEEPVIEAIKAAEERLTNSTSFLRFLGNRTFILPDDLPRITSEGDFEHIEEEYHFLSLALNLANTFLYMVNTYIIVPTADKYASSLNVAPTVCGVIIGSMAVAQLVSSVYFSAWSNKSYFEPLIFSSVMLLLGNVCYAIAYDFRSIALLLLGRLLCGFGSARAVNRRYISDCVPAKMRLKASAAFVSASALGMACGPALAGLLTFNRKLLGVTFDSNTLPGWVMVIGWLVYLVFLLFGFKEPSHDTPSTSTSSGSSKKKKLDIATIEGNDRSPFEAEQGILDPLLTSSNSNLCKDSESDDEKETSEPASSIWEAYKLLTGPVKVQLLIYFMLKFALEILLSESSVVTAYYFAWNAQSVSIFLALLGLTVLPINYIVGSYISNSYEDRQILLFSEILTCVGVVVSFAYFGIPYTVEQYVTGALLIFVSAEVLEGVNLALLSKVMSSRLARGTFNGGLLSTEAGTLARVVADVAITLAGYLGDNLVLNVTMLPTLVIGIATIVATIATYNSFF